MNVPVAANILGTIGAVCWSVQLLPQILLNYRRHSAAGLQPSFMMTWALAGVPLAVFNTVQRFNVALQVQPQILTSLSLLTWAQCCYYESKWPLRKCLAVIAPLILLMAALETALILSIRIALDRHVEWPTTLMGVLAGVLLCCGVLREYWDIYSHNTVRGISFLFCGIDAAGDFFSVLSVRECIIHLLCAVSVSYPWNSLPAALRLCGHWTLFGRIPSLVWHILLWNTLSTHSMAEALRCSPDSPYTSPCNRCCPARLAG